MGASAQKHRVERDERTGAWVIDGERYVAAQICGRVHLLPIGAPLVIDEQPTEAQIQVVIHRPARPS